MVNNTADANLKLPFKKQLPRQFHEDMGYILIFNKKILGAGFYLPLT